MSWKENVVIICFLVLLSFSLCWSVQALAFSTAIFFENRTDYLCQVIRYRTTDDTIMDDSALVVPVQVGEKRKIVFKYIGRGAHYTSIFLRYECGHQLFDFTVQRTRDRFIKVKADWDRSAMYVFTDYYERMPLLGVHFSAWVLPP